MKEMEFTKYGSLENTYRQKFINDCVEQGLDTGVWQVSEKIHGANFAIYYNGSEMKFAKRTSFIGENSSFFNWQDAIEFDDIRNKVKNLFEGIKGNRDDTNEIKVMGELCGGLYPHKEVEISTHKAIQKGVFYSNNQRFVAYDLYVNNEIVSNSLAYGFLETIGFTVAKTLFTGSLKDCLEFPNDNESELYKAFGLPKIEDNIMEGVVIKPLHDVKFYKTGSRVIFKNKNEKFSEKSKKPKTIKQRKELLTCESELIELISVYITENRLRNVISHIGDVNNKMFGKLQGMLMKDVMVDAMKEENIKGLINITEKTSMKIVSKNLSKLCIELIRPNFLNIIDKTF